MGVVKNFQLLIFTLVHMHSKGFMVSILLAVYIYIYICGLKKQRFRDLIFYLKVQQWTSSMPVLAKTVVTQCNLLYSASSTLVNS